MFRRKSGLVSIPLADISNPAACSGKPVSKGQVIAVIENPQFIQLQQDYLMARSKMHFAELDYNRQKTLNQSQATSDKVMQQAQSEMNSQKILMNSLAQQLRLININPESLKIREYYEKRSGLQQYQWVCE
jgi:cobalt-zinc-cadmium efflux system membrane fusion protein